MGNLGSIPGLGRSPGEGKGYPLKYSGLENSMDCIVHGVTQSWTQLSNFQFTYIYTHTYRDRDWDGLKAGREGNSYLFQYSGLENSWTV